MSNNVNTMIAEGLVDEYYDDPNVAKDWLVNICHVNIHGLSEDDLVDLYVQCSIDRMGD